MPDATDLGFTLLPADDAGLSAADELLAAAASALAPDFTEAPGQAPIPLGRTWLFDFERGVMQRRGTRPAEALGADALEVWCLTAIHSARYGHWVFSDEFGVEEPDEWIGDLPDGVLLRRIERGIRRALTVHDRIEDVTDFVMWADPADGTVYIDSFTLQQDEDDHVRLAFPNPITITPPGGVDA